MHARVSSIKHQHHHREMKAVMSELIAENDIIDKGTVSGFKRQLFQFMQSLTTTQNINNLI